MPLLVDLSTLPEDGLALQGELPAEIFDFPAHDDAKAVSPLCYDLFVQRFGSELLLRGDLSTSFEFTCVVTLQRFIQTIRLHSVAISVELENEAPVDIADALREEIVIEMPSDPRCDEADTPMECRLNSPYLVLDKTTDSDLSSPPPPPADSRWSALDALSDLNDNH
ncbi:MAG: hypothetical protein EAZ81_06180 [Verrucomicrobia bacterium]|jgi:uncharacterized metal-binding protein YceD (DUF177 family)|nr:MAG: hypothetical protein EAZ81_06180 [Verrucomicrobiota bacterium]